MSVPAASTPRAVLAAAAVVAPVPPAAILSVPLICVKFMLFPPTLYPDTAFIYPFTSNFSAGEATPTPTLPPFIIVNTLVPSSWNSTIGLVPV